MVNKVLLDTNVVIGILNQQEWALEYLLKIKRTLISVISIMELFGLAGMEKTEEEKINDLIGTFQIVPITSRIALRAGYLVRTRPNRGQRADLLIAATALEMGCELVTRNTKDFRGIMGLRLIS